MATETSIWKKEIRLRRRPPMDVQTNSVESPPSVSRWETPKREELWIARADSETDQAVPVVEISDLPESSAVEKTSIWKKEITLRRSATLAAADESETDVTTPVVSPEDSQPEPAATEKTAVWKKEISLARRSKPSMIAEAPPVPESPATEKTSMWKKEITLRRSAPSKAAEESPLEDTAAVVSLIERWTESATEEPATGKKEIVPSLSVTPAVADGSEAAVTTPVVSPEDSQPEPSATEKTSVWKKEISLSRPKKTPKAVDVAHTTERVVAKKQPIWKKDFSLRREPKTDLQPSLPAADMPEKPSVRESLLKRNAQIRFQRRPKVAPEVATLVGLRIGSSQLAAALVNNNGSAELVKLARVPLARGIVTAGEVRDPDALARALKRFFVAQKLPRRGVRLGIATNRIGVRVIEVPEIEDPKLFANAIRFRAQEVVPIPLADAVLDHVVLGKTDDGKEQRVLVVFAHRELVNGYVDACNRAGLKLAGIDFDAFALLRALSDGSEPSNEMSTALVAVAIGHERTIFAVSEGSICDFARVLEWGGSAFDKALARAIDVAPEEAESVKQTLSLAGDETGGLAGVQLEAARTALRQELQVLARELLSSLQFYQSRPDSLDIGEVLLTGGAAQLPGICEELERQLGVPVRMGDPLGRVTFAPDAERPASSGSLAIAIGLGIED